MVSVKLAICAEKCTLWTSAEVEQFFVIVISHLSSPAGSVRPVCFEETEREIRCEQSIPMPLLPRFGEEQAHGGIRKLHVDGAVGALQCPIMF